MNCTVRNPVLSAPTFPSPFRPFHDEDISVGAMVKLGFVAEEFADDEDLGIEWMWLHVERRVETGGFVGRLDNRPVFVPYQLGDLIRFDALHVLGVVGSVGHVGGAR